MLQIYLILKRKKMLTLTKEELKLHQNARNCYICGKRILQKLTKSEIVRDHCHYTGKYRGAHILFVKFVVPNKIPVVFHSGSNYDYHCTIKELANEFEGKFEYLGENTEKYFSQLFPFQ